MYAEGTVGRPQWELRGWWGTVVEVQVADDVLDEVAVIKQRNE